MEHEDGHSLERWLVRVHQLQTGDAVNVALQCANALEAIHDAHLIHRFVDLENVIVGRHGRVRLSPGVPLNVDADLKSSDAGNRIVPGQTIGTLPTTASSDVYALGLALYTMLTGERSFDVDSHLEPHSKIVEETTRPLHSADYAIPDALCNTIVGALARDPGERPDVTTFSDQLRETVLANECLSFLAQ